MSALSGNWDLSLGASRQKLGSASGLGSTLTAGLRGVVSLEGVVVLLGDGNISVD